MKMAILFCKKCSNEISTKAKTCPKCVADASKRSLSPTALLLAFLIFDVVLGIFVYLSSSGSSKASSIQAQSVAEEISSKAIKAIASVEGQASWENVVTTKSETGDYRLKIIYKKMPDGCDEVEHDTKKVARFVYDALVKSGGYPSKDHVIIEVGASLSDKVGAPYDFGTSDYNYILDEFVFYPGVTPGSDTDISNNLLAHCQNHSVNYAPEKIKQAEYIVGTEELKKAEEKNPELKALNDRFKAIKEGRAVPEIKFGGTLLQAMSESDIKRSKFEDGIRGRQLYLGGNHPSKPDQAFEACVDQVRHWYFARNAVIDSQQYNYRGRHSNGDYVVDVFTAESLANITMRMTITCVVRDQGIYWRLVNFRASRYLEVGRL